ncbi:amidase [Chitinimonas arctica]|uniref:Amidase n=1 Tax=Chitinimonas arctica TaxID=2594795 RepID=A0A516SLT5_9NEIS|nr:amidase [Chitinimonas arctica]QDQ29112.1 amidase [Chitinimonas arctica]
MNDYLDHDATSLSQLVRQGQIHPSELLNAAIARCGAVNPALNAVIVPLFEQAATAAAGPLPDGPFSGVPFLLKDLLAALAGVPLSNGCKAMRHFVPDVDSELVRRFKAAGLVIFGKTNTPELGLLGYTEPILWGPTRNPWSAAHSPGGSSGGAAAAVAAGIVPMAHGGDGGGSIRIPASNCGLFGLKPSRGRVPLGPLIGEAWQGAVQEGVLSRSVRDSAAMLDWIAGPDSGSPYEIAPPAAGFLAACTRPPGALRIGFVRTAPAGPLHADCVAALDDTVTLLQRLGHHVDEVALPYDFELLLESYLTMYYGEIAADLRWIGQLLGRQLRRDDVELETWVMSRLGNALSAADFSSAKRGWNQLGREMGRFHQQYDLLLTPTLATPPVRIGELRTPGTIRSALRTVDTFGGIRLLRGAIHAEARRNFSRMPFTQIANLTGQPAMSVPLHWNAAGLPIGSQFIAAINREECLFSLAAQLESARPWAMRRPAPPQA